VRSESLWLNKDRHGAAAEPPSAACTACPGKESTERIDRAKGHRASHSADYGARGGIVNNICSANANFLNSAWAAEVV
jgi:hypothetical protein